MVQLSHMSCWPNGLSEVCKWQGFVIVFQSKTFRLSSLLLPRVQHLSPLKFLCYFTLPPLLFYPSHYILIKTFTRTRNYTAVSSFITAKAPVAPRRHPLSNPLSWFTVSFSLALTPNTFLQLVTHFLSQCWVLGAHQPEFCKVCQSRSRPDKPLPIQQLMMNFLFYFEQALPLCPIVPV